jgi:hypothetical protein
MFFSKCLEKRPIHMIENQLIKFFKWPSCDKGCKLPLLSVELCKLLGADGSRGIQSSLISQISLTGCTYSGFGTLRVVYSPKWRRLKLTFRGFIFANIHNIFTTTRNTTKYVSNTIWGSVLPRKSLWGTLHTVVKACNWGNAKVVSMSENVQNYPMMKSRLWNLWFGRLHSQTWVTKSDWRNRSNPLYGHIHFDMTPPIASWFIDFNAWMVQPSHKNYFWSKIEMCK